MGMGDVLLRVSAGRAAVVAPRARGGSWPW